MTLLKREEWQDIAGDVAWTYGFVDEDAVYPEIHSGTGKVPREAWAAWEESYKVIYPEYVTTQQEKETSTYAVRAALQRSNAFDTLSEGRKSATKMHFGGVALVEYAGLLGELRMARFGLSPRWRNMAVFGSLDEIRHTQITCSSDTSSSAGIRSTTGRRKPSTPTTGSRSRCATCSTR
ncbi:hypothetical protein [Kibdelosporangium aridum]|uniref:hypothetical protein n=1 Tax=Kibdelosporangium aridum TaxID=2030 RepID=UPI0021AD8270|nr:hypothetical protein [Kibdelosporangium aridum]